LLAKLPTLADLSTVGPRLALWAAVLGFLALGLWQLASAVAVRTHGQSSQWADKIKGISKAVIYLALAWTRILEPSAAAGRFGSLNR